jgi:hypothetical protein
MKQCLTRTQPRLVWIPKKSQTINAETNLDLRAGFPNSSSPLPYQQLHQNLISHPLRTLENPSPPPPADIAGASEAMENFPINPNPLAQGRLMKIVLPQARQHPGQTNSLNRVSGPQQHREDALIC